MKRIENTLKNMTFDFFGSGKHKTDPASLFSDENAVFLDVRSNEENDTLTFPLSHHIQVIHIPTDEIPERTEEIPKDRPVAIFCPAGVRASMVYLYLKGLGYENIKILEGGYEGLTAELKPGKIRKHIAGKNS